MKTRKRYSLDILELLKRINLSNDIPWFEPIMFIINDYHNVVMYKEFVEDNFNELAFKMLSSVRNPGLFEFKNFFELYGYSFDDFVSENIDIVHVAIDRITDEILSDVIESNQHPDEGDEVGLILEAAANMGKVVRFIFFPKVEADFEFDIKTPKIQSFINEFNAWQNYILANSGPGSNWMIRQEIIDDNVEINIENLFSSPSTLDS